MNNKPSTFVNLIQGLSNFYSEIKLANKEAGQYKISEIIAGELGEEPIIIAQIRNKTTSYSLKIMDVVSNERVLNQFSRQDIKIIVYIACEYKNRPKIKIEGLNFCAKIKKIVFSFVNSSSNKSIQNKTASELMNDNKTIAEMSSHDAAKIGYTAGTELYQDHQTQISQLKKDDE